MLNPTRALGLLPLLALSLGGCLRNSDFDGPNWDAETGYAFYTPGDQYVVVATYADAEDESKDLLSAYFPLVDEQIWASEGLVTYSLGMSWGDMVHGRGRTLSVWRDYESLGAFVYSGDHQNVMESAGPRLGGSAIDVWTMDGADLPPTWEEADARIQALLEEE